MKRKDQNNKQEKATGRRYGRTVRGVSIALALVFGLSSLTTAIPAGATDSTSSSAESTASSGIKETKSSSTDENTTSFATDGMKSSSGNGNSSSDTASTADTDAASEASSTASDVGYKKKVDVEEKDNKLTVTAKADKGVLPEDADLTVKPIKANADQKVEDQLKTSLTAENQELAGFLAYDISFNKEDNEVEPTGKVNLKLSWENGITPKVDAADALKGTKVSVLHLEKDKNSADKDDAKIKVVNLTKNQEKAEEERKNSENNDKDNKEKLAVNGAKVTTGEDSMAVEKAEMTVDSFSTFAIAWTKDKDSKAQVKLPTAENDDYKVTVSYDKNTVRNIPEKAKVSVKSYSENSEAYAIAKQAVLSQKKEENKDFNEDALGLKALDISILDPSTNEEIEPDGKVAVSIELKKLPEGVEKGDSLNIQHIVSKDEADAASEDKAASSDTDANEAKASETAKADTEQCQVKAETVASDVKAKDGTVATFETESFSTYTVQWESDQTGASTDNYRSLNGRTVMIVYKKDDKYYALSSDYKNEEKGYLKLVKVTYDETNKTLTYDDDDDHKNIYWRFTRSGEDDDTFFIESVKKGGIAKEDGHKNDFTYLKHDSTKQEKNSYGTKVGYGLSIEENNRGREKYSVVSAGTNTVRITTTQDSRECSLNVANGQPNDGVHLWEDNNSDNAKFTLYDVDTSKSGNYTISPIKTIDSIAKGINITMFDYKGRDDNNKNDPKYENDGQESQGGVVQNKYIKNDGRITNNFTQGIVENKLSNDGYPTVSESYSSDSQTDLKTLFSSDDKEKDGDTQAYTNVNNLFSEDEYNETGYYSYNCFKNYAYLNTNVNDKGERDFTVYNQIGTPLTAGYYGKSRNDTSAFQRGNFMPFNDLYKHNGEGEKINKSEQFSTFTNEFDGTDIPLQDSKDSDVRDQAGRKLYKTQGFLDYYFGMKMEMNFIQPENGRVPVKPGSDNLTDMIYEFNGDDDLWVFVDNALLLDIGGIHGACHGKIDFSTGKITYVSWEQGDYDKNFYIDNDKTKGLKQGFEKNDDGTYSISIAQCFKNANILPDGVTAWSDDGAKQYFSQNASGEFTTFKNYTTHSLKMFYMERGAGASDLQMRFNLQSIPSDEFTVTKNITNADADRFKDVKYKFQAYFKKSNDTETGSTTSTYVAITGDIYNDWNNARENKLDKPYYIDTNGTREDINFEEDGSFYLSPGQVAHFPLPQTNDYYCVQEDIGDQSKCECTGITNGKGQSETINHQLIDGTNDTKINRSPDYLLEDNKAVNFTNRVFEQELKLVKVDSSDIEKKLSGAVFTLVNQNSSTSNTLTDTQLSGYLKKSDTNGVFSKYVQTNGTDDGVITLPVGTYTLTETTAPAGYNLSKTPWTITVTKERVTISPETRNNTSTVTSTTDNTYTITIKNTPGAVLPNTGGKGTWPFVVAGSVLILSAAYLLYMQQNRKNSYR